MTKLFLLTLILGWLADLDIVMLERYTMEEVSTLVLLIIQACPL